MIEILLARRLARIRKRRFLFVRIEFAAPWDRMGWVVTGVMLGGRAIQLASGRNLWTVLDQAEAVADARWDPFGVSLEESA